MNAGDRVVVADEIVARPTAGTVLGFLASGVRVALDGGFWTVVVPRSSVRLGEVER